MTTKKKFWAHEYFRGNRTIIVGHPSKYPNSEEPGIEHLETNARKRRLAHKYAVDKLSEEGAGSQISSLFIDCAYLDTKAPLEFLIEIQNKMDAVFVLLAEVPAPTTPKQQKNFDAWLDLYLSLSHVCALQFKSIEKGSLKFSIVINKSLLSIGSRSTFDEGLRKQSVGNLAVAAAKLHHNDGYFLDGADQPFEEHEFQAQLTRQHIFDLHEQVARLRSTIFEQKNTLSVKQRELEVSQAKRSGHWDLASKVQATNKQLVGDIQMLRAQLDTLGSSRSFALGFRLLHAKSVRAIIRLPRELLRIFLGKHPTGKYADNKDVQRVLDDTEYVNRPQGLMVGGLQRANEVKLGSSLVDTMPILGWRRTVGDVNKPTVMSVCDDFTMACLDEGFNNISPRPDNWRALKALEKPEFLFVESAWAGNHGAWQYRVGSYKNAPGNELAEMVDAFKAEGLPTIFWNKEDPFHFYKFEDAAKQFDIILTTDENSIPKYRERTRAHLDCLPFFAIAKQHNPMGASKRIQKACFGGSFYKNRFLERQADMINIMRAAQGVGLDIYDRNFGSGDADMEFPEEFRKNILGRLPFSKMNAAYRAYRVFLNVNSVTDSNTMLSRRVFELLASGTPVVSTPSAAIHNFFGKDIVWQASEIGEMEEGLRLLMNDDVEWRRRSLAGIRCVHGVHTIDHNIDLILGQTSMRTDAKARIAPRICVVVAPRTQDDLDAFIENFRRQTYENKTLVVVSRAPKLSAPSFDCEFIPANDLTLNENIERIRGEMPLTHIAQFSNEFVYGKYHLQDLMIAMNYSGADVVGKNMSGMDPYAFITDVEHGTCLFNWERLYSETFDTRDVLDSGDYSGLVANGLKMYCGDNANVYKCTNRSELLPPKVDKIIAKIEA